MKGFIRFFPEARRRVLSNEHQRELIESLLDAADFVSGLIDVGKEPCAYEDEHALLHAIHKVIHSQKTMHQPGPEDQQEFFAKPREIELSQTYGISVGLLRLQMFNGLRSILNENSLTIETVWHALDQVLAEAEIEDILQQAIELPNLPPLLALIVRLSVYIDLYHFLHIIVLDHRDKDIFITDQGRIGMAFQGVQHDDVVALWQGCPSPMIVRKISSDGEDMYRLHGPAFVDGLMTGESWPLDKTKLEEFNVV